MRAHQLVRAGDATAHEQELTEVHTRIVHSSGASTSRILGDLASYVSALRQRVEQHLA